MQRNLCQGQAVAVELASEVALLVSKIETIADVVFGRRLSEEEMAQLLAELALEATNV